MATGILKAGKYSSKAAAAASAVSNLSEPLLSSATKKSRTTDSLSSYDGSDDDESTAMSEGILPEKMSAKDKAVGAGIGLLVAGSMAAAASAMVAAPTVVVFLMGGLSILNSPTVVHKHIKIAKSVGIRQAINNIRQEIGLIKSEVDFLHETVNDLKAEAGVLVEVEQGLQEIAATQGVQVNRIIELVNENEQILNEMKSNMRQTFAAAVARVVVQSDTDGDQTISLKEAPVLALRLQMQIEPYGIKLDAKKFEDMIREDNDIGSIIKFCANMLYEDDEDEDEESDNDSVDSELTFDFEAFCHNLDEEVEETRNKRMTMKDKLSMVTVDDRYSKGSVDVARGKRMTLLPGGSAKDERRKTIMKEVRKRQTRLSHRRSTVSRRTTTSRGTNSSGPQSPERGSRVTFAQRFSFLTPVEEVDEEAGLPIIEESPRPQMRGGPAPGRGGPGRGFGAGRGGGQMTRSRAKRGFSQLRR